MFVCKHLADNVDGLRGVLRPAGYQFLRGLPPGRDLGGWIRDDRAQYLDALRQHVGHSTQRFALAPGGLEDLARLSGLVAR